MSNSNVFFGFPSNHLDGEAPRVLSRFAWRILTAALMLLVLVPDSFAQRVGDRVLITTDYETKIKEKKVDKVFAGQIRTLSAIESPWVAVAGTEGWLPANYALSMAQGLKYCGDRIRANANDAAAYSIRGSVQLELGKLDEALLDFSQALKINPQAPVPWNNRALVYMAQGKWSESLRDLNQALQLNPNFVDALVNRSLVFGHAERPEDGLKDIERAIQLDAQNARHYIRRGSLWFDLGQFEKARGDYDRAAAIDPRLADIYLGRGNLLLAEGKMTEALAQAERAVELQPNLASAHNLLGWLKFENRQTDEAIRSLSRAINLDPTMAIAYSNRGVARVEQGELDQALADFDRSLQMDPQAALTFCNRATAWMKKGEYEKARSDFEQSLKLVPDLPEALNVYAWFLSTCPDDAFRNGAKAVEFAEKAIQGSEGPQWFQLDTLAAAKAEVGEFDRAVELQRKALELVPDDRKAACQSRLDSYLNGEPTRGAATPQAGSGRG